MKKFVIVATPLILLALLLAVTACKEKSDGGPSAPTLAPVHTRIAFQTGIEPTLYELPSHALATWREFAGYKPVLLLFSTHPLLSPIPNDRTDAVAKLLREGSADVIIQRACMLTANPTILPPETVSAAIDNGIFSELVIVLPNIKKPEEVNLADLRKRMISAGFLSEVEATGLTLKDGVVSGAVRGLPLRIAHPEHLPKIAAPIILHVDLGYFKDMYVNEVKTPAYDLLHQLATSLKDAAYPTLASTLSFSNQEVGFSLESRFMIRDLAEILRQPQLLDGNTPASWSLRAQALYATAMFDESRARELIAQAVKATPSDAHAHYALALDLFEQRRAAEGFAALDRAVTLDHGYGLEYLTLAERGKELGQTEKSIDLLQKATQVMPNNPFIRRELAHQLIQTGRVKEARPLIAELRRLNWSESFYPDVPPLLKKMAEAASVDVVLPKVAPLPTTDSSQRPARPASGMPGFNHMGMGHPGR